MTLTLLETAEAALSDARPCVAFLGVHTSSMDAAHQLVDDLPHWIDGVYLQLSPVNPLHDSPSKIIDALMLMRERTVPTAHRRTSAISSVLRSSW